MSAGSRNFAIVRRRTRSVTATPGSSSDLEELGMQDRRYILIAAAWSKVVDILCSPRGLSAVRSYSMFALQQQGHVGLTMDHTIVKGVAQVFLAKVQNTSPLLIDDGTFESRRQVSEHPRGSWSGSYTSFDVRRQAIKLNSHWVNNAEQALIGFLVNRESIPHSANFQLALFKLVHAFSHEAGHLLQTFLGRGEENTPPGLSGGASTRDSNSFGGESGEVMEMMLFGGLVDFYNDSSPAGSLPTGFPWATPPSGGSWRVDLFSIGLLLQPAWVGSDEPIISQSQIQSESLRDGIARPRVQNGQLVSSMIPSSPVQYNIRTGLGHRREGSSVEVAVLRRLSSPPVNLSPGQASAS